MQFDRLNRRDFIAALGGAAAAWPLKVGAQQAPVRPLIGLLSPITAADAKPFITAFRSALRDLGYVEGRNMAIAITLKARPSAWDYLPANWWRSIPT
jgi:hypothetical protein